jgi:hypothetical protein
MKLTPEQQSQLEYLLITLLVKSERKVKELKDEWNKAKVHGWKSIEEAYLILLEDEEEIVDRTKEMLNLLRG